MALPDFKGAITRATAAGLTAAAFFTSPAAVNDAQAQQAPAATAQQVDIRMRDLSSGKAENVRTIAADGSKGGQVVVFFGDKNSAAFAATVQGMQAAKAQGLPVKGIVLGPSLTPVKVNGVHISGSTQVEFYTHGVRTATIDNPSPNVANGVTLELQRGYATLLANTDSAASK